MICVIPWTDYIYYIIKLVKCKFYTTIVFSVSLVLLIYYNVQATHSTTQKGLPQKYIFLKAAGLGEYSV